MAAYEIGVEFSPNWTDGGKPHLLSAAARWMKIVTASPPPANIGSGRVVTGLLVRTDIVPGAPGGRFARSGPDQNRPKSADYLPATAILELERADYDSLLNSGRLETVLFHELGHGMGFGNNWPLKGLIQDAGVDPHFVGPQGQAAYGALRGTGAQPVPVEAGGGVGVANFHWRETIFGNEIMSPYIPTMPNPLSRLTLASMIDLGYQIDLSKAEAYALPAANLFDKRIGPETPSYRVVPTNPSILPDEALVPALASRRRAKRSGALKRQTTADGG